MASFRFLLSAATQRVSLYAVAPVGRYKLAVPFERALTRLIPALLALCLQAGFAFAQQPVRDRVVQLDIPRQQADGALTALGQQADITVLYRYDVVRSYRTNVVSGQYRLAIAVAELLKNTRLKAEFAPSGHLIVTRIEEDEQVIMVRKEPKKTVLATVISALFGVAAAGQVWAQSGAEAGIEEVVVTGVRGSIVRALDQKRNAIGVSDSISAEDIGKFPDLNLSESLQRIPGVTLNRNTSGEGQALNVRGLGPEFTRVEVNGMSGTANGSGGRFGNSEGGRGFNFELLASELFSNATVYKSISASQAEGGLAGTVALKTPRPFDYPGARFSASIQGNYSEITGDTDPRAAVLVSRNFDDTFGIAASLAFSDTSFRTDTVEGGVWRPLGNTAGAPLVANGTRLYNFTNERENLGSTLTVQFRPSYQLEMTLDGIYATSDSERVANRDDAPIEGGQTGVGGTLVVENNVVTAGDFTGVQQRVGTNFFTTDEDFTQLTLTADWTPNENWLISPFMGYSTREAARTRDLYSFRLADTSNPGNISFDPGTISYQLRGDYVDFSSDQTDFASNPGNFLFNVFILRPSTDEDEEFTTRLDFERLINDEGLTSIQFGVRYADRSKTRTQTQERLQRLAGVGIELPPNLSSVAQLLELDVDGADANLPASILAANPSLIRDVFYPGGDAVAGTFIRPLPGFGAQESWQIEEQTFNAYFQANFEIGAAQFNAGLRLVRTDQTSSGFTVENIFQPTERITPISVDTHYTEYLPSASLRYEIQEELIFRTAYSTTLTRANLPQLAPSESVRGISEVDGGTGSRGNPQLQPFTADNFDIGIEWYFAEEGILSLAFFYKDIGSLIDTTTFTESREFPRQADGVLVTGDILFTQPVNGESANVQGLELALQTALAGNFGALFNYTYTDSEADFGDEDDVRSTGLPGLSENSLNVSFYYDDGRLDARLSYAWRDRYLAQFSDDFGVSRFIDDFGQLDFSANYRLNDNLQLQFQVLNITEEQRINQATSQFLPYGVSELDRRVFFGARYAF